MTITIVKNTSPEYLLTLQDCRNGKAYEDIEGNIYICNTAQIGNATVVLIEVTGKYVIRVGSGSDLRLREINLKIIVE